MRMPFWRMACGIPIVRCDHSFGRLWGAVRTGMHRLALLCGLGGTDPAMGFLPNDALDGVFCSTTSYPFSAFANAENVLL